MKINIKKVFIILMCSILIFSFFSNCVYGYEWNFTRFDGEDTGDTGTKLLNASSSIIAIVQVVAIGIAVMMLVVFGINYVITSSTDKKVEMKKNMPNYIVGVILTFSAAVILQILREFIDKNINE